MSIISTTESKKENLLPLKDITDLVNVPSLILSEKVIAQISYYHHKVKGSEWSGPLIYSRTGADDLLKLFKDGNNETMELRAEDILIADIGTPGYTSYKLDGPALMSKVMDYQLDGKHLGHSHSHQNMRTFFSGVDNEELQENTPNHKMYLSLIVNYLDGGEFTARICCKTTEKVSVMDYLSNLKFFNKKKQEVDLSDIFTEKEVIYYINVPVVYGLDSDTLERYDNVVKAKEVVRTPISQFPKSVYGNVGRGWTRETFGKHNPGRQLSLADFTDDGDFIDDTPIEAGLPMDRAHLIDYLYRIFSLDFETDSDDITLKKIHDLFNEIQHKYSKVQLDTVEKNLESCTEYVVELVWGDGKPITLEEDQIFEVVEEVNALIGKDFSKYTKVAKLFDDYYNYAKETMLESPFIEDNSSQSLIDKYSHLYD